jgi:hypothetical protein
MRDHLIICLRDAMHLQANYEQIPLKDYAERAYLDYSMYVVLDRALPFIGDGLNFRDERTRIGRRR